MQPAIHITGASGSGASMLGRALADRIGALHLDRDDFYWAPVEWRLQYDAGPKEGPVLRLDGTVPTPDLVEGALGGQPDIARVA
jgi:adenylate kinase family enzyme